MSRRFFCEQPITTETVELSESEAHHVIHVMRAKVGDEVMLFDGTGVECAATIARIGRRDVELRVQSRSLVDRELPFDVVLAVALPRGDRQEWLVQKAVELGVTRLVPWHTQRSVARPKAKSLERLRRTVVEASKQCGRNRLMDIAEPCDYESVLPQAEQRRSLLAHVGAAVGPHSALNELPREISASGIQFGIGPEGGFTDQEAELAAAAGWQLVDLGPRILRTETAAVVLAAYVALAPVRSA